MVVRAFVGHFWIRFDGRSWCHSACRVRSITLANGRARGAGHFDNPLALLDALAERYVEEGRVAGMVNVVMRNGNLACMREPRVIDR